MSTTSDPNDPRLSRGVDDAPTVMADTYLVLSEAERAKGFVRPLRRTYVHVGIAGPKYPLSELNSDDDAGYADAFVAFERYPEGSIEAEGSAVGRYWTQDQLDSVGKGCGAATHMGQALAETYAREPRFYGATWCVGCSMHRPVGKDGEFVWDDGSRVGT